MSVCPRLDTLGSNPAPLMTGLGSKGQAAWHYGGRGRAGSGLRRLSSSRTLCPGWLASCKIPHFLRGLWGITIVPTSRGHWVQRGQGKAVQGGFRACELTPARSLSVHAEQAGMVEPTSRGCFRTVV